MNDVKREWFEVDYYKVLSVAATSTAKEITTAYRKLARKYHPDANPGDTAAEERFKEISAAYDVVGDEARRKEYDQVRRMGPAGGMFGGGGSRGPGPGDFEGMGDISDLLGSVLGGQAGGLFGNAGRGAPRNHARKGPDLEARLVISFEEAVGGLTTTLNVGPERRQVKIKIPAGIESGQKVRLRGKGGEGSGGGRAGDLLVLIDVGNHGRFDRSGKNLTLEVPITFVEAVRGADLKVPTFAGSTVTLRIPPGTQSGRKFRVKGQGIETAKGTGDLLVSVIVHVPETLTDDQDTALDGWAEAATEDPRANWDQ